MSEWMSDRVSIITPMYNSSRFIGETIYSVLAQTYVDWEMIIVDDASTDNSREVVEEFVQKDNRIQLIKLEYNQGISKARNTAIQYATGRYLAFLDSDDLWLSDKLSIQLYHMKETGCGFCYTGCYVIDHDGTMVKKERKVPKHIQYHELLKGNDIPCLTVVLDRNRFHEITFRNIRHEDYAAWLDLLKQDNGAIGIQKPLAKYRISTQSVSANKFKSILWTWNVIRNQPNVNLFRSFYYLILATYKSIKKWY